MADIDNADKIFEEEPGDPLDDAVADFPLDMQRYLKGITKMIMPGVGIKGVLFQKPAFDYRVLLFSLYNAESSMSSQTRMQQILDQGWSVRPDLTLEHDGHFLVTFQREREPDSSVKNDSANSVADSEKSSVENA